MKKFLIFTFFGPPIGVMLFFLPSLIGVLIFEDNSSFLTLGQGLSLFPMFFVMGYFNAIIPAFITGVIATFLKFKNPWMNYSVLMVLSTMTCVTYFSCHRANDFILPSIVGIATTMVLGYVVFLRVNSVSKKVDEYEEK